jgi:hypothetical protein
VLAIQDKTELDLGNRRRTRGIGAIGNKAAKGLHLHTTLAVSESGVPLGLLSAKMWAREKVRKDKRVQERKRAIGEPGVLTLWRGWQRLKDMMIVWQLMLNES